MKLRAKDLLKEEVIEKVVKKLPKSVFTTNEFVEFLEVTFPDISKTLKSISEKSYRSMIGRELRRYSENTQKITQISRPADSPVKWKRYL